MRYRFVLALTTVVLAAIFIVIVLNVHSVKETAQNPIVIQHFVPETKAKPVPAQEKYFPPSEIVKFYYEVQFLNDLFKKLNTTLLSFHSPALSVFDWSSSRLTDMIQFDNEWHKNAAHKLEEIRFYTIRNITSSPQYKVQLVREIQQLQQEYYVHAFQEKIVQIKGDIEESNDMLKKFELTVKPSVNNVTNQNVLKQVSLAADSFEESLKDHTFQRESGELQTMKKLTHKGNATNVFTWIHSFFHLGTSVKVVDDQNNQFCLAKPHDITELYEDPALLSDLLFLYLVGSIFGAICELLIRLPMFLGFIAAGVIFGPSGLNFIQNPVQIESIAQFGVILMLFLFGLEVNFSAIKNVLKISLISAFGLTVGILLMAIGFFIHNESSLVEGFIIGFSISMSSTAVTIRLFKEKARTDRPAHRKRRSKSVDSTEITPYNEVGSLSSETVTGILAIQDLMLCLFMGLYSSIGNNAASTPYVLYNVLKMLVILGGYILFLYYTIHVMIVKPFFIRLFIGTRAESIQFFSVALTISIAYVAEKLGLSLEMGCFLAGIILSLKALADPNFEVSIVSPSEKIVPVLEPVVTFFSLPFFVSIGMHIYPAFLYSQLRNLLGMTLLVISVKFLLVVIIIAFTSKTFTRGEIWTISLALSQVSEFAFVLSSKAKALGLISREGYYLTIGVTAMTLLLVPILWNIAIYCFSKLSRPSNRKEN